jgi:hypothetical protein
MVQWREALKNLSRAGPSRSTFSSAKKAMGGSEMMTQKGKTRAICSKVRDTVCQNPETACIEKLRSNLISFPF